MRYLCLVYFEPVTFEGMPAEEGRTLNRDSLAYDDELRASGHYIASNALQSVQSAVTVRVRNKRISTSDGPFAETKEHLGGFILIDAADSRRGGPDRLGTSPWPQYGSVEVRPIYDIPVE